MEIAFFCVLTIIACLYQALEALMRLKVPIFVLSLLFSSVFLSGCGNSNHTEDVNSGTMIPRDCHVQIQRSQLVRQSVVMEEQTAYVDIPTSIQSGKRIVRLYNEQTCDGELNTDYFGATNEYFSIESNYFGIRLAKGINFINFKVEMCTEIRIESGYACIGQVEKDEGTFTIEVQ